MTESELSPQTLQRAYGVVKSNTNGIKVNGSSDSNKVSGEICSN